MTDNLRATLAELVEFRAALAGVAEHLFVANGWAIWRVKRTLDAALASTSAAPDSQPVPDGWKLLRDTTLEERSWQADVSHENGNYSCLCCHCGRMFYGHKRRVCCKDCAAPHIEGRPS